MNPPDRPDPPPGPRPAPLPDGAAWLETHGDVLFSYARSRGLPVSDAEDLVQETLLTGLERWPSFRGDSTVRTWLVGILRYKILEHARAGQHWESWSPEAAMALFSSRGKWRLGHPRRWRRGPEEVAEDDEFRATLLRCLGGLPETLADAFLLVQVHGLEPAKVASLLGSTANNVHVMLFRARAGLRHCLETSWFRKDRG